jgi:hypothetical protein
MNPHREDVICPACPDPDTAFRIEDVGMKFATDGDQLTGDRMTFTVSRPAWEPVMLTHLRAKDDDEHQRLYDLCVTELIAAEKTPEDVARDDVQSVAGWYRRRLDDSLGRLP